MSGEIITTVAGNGVPAFAGDGGPATSASLNYPYGVAVDSAGTLYIADTYNNRIRKVSNGVITTVASVAEPKCVTVDSDGNVYVSNTSNILKTLSRIVTTVAGYIGVGYGGDGGP